MSSYRGTADRPDRPDKAKAIAAVAAVHAALAFLILSGLNVRMVSRVVAKMTTISIREPPPLPRPIAKAKAAPKPELMKNPEGRGPRKAEPAPVPQPRVKILPSPQPTARTTDSGTAPAPGAAQGTTGIGARGAGNGPGGGGYADYSRFTPARLLENIPDAEYRQLASTGIPSGLVGVIILVNPGGTVSNCRIARSSGDPAIDALVCQLTLRYVRFDPARDPSGRPVAQDITYFPSWRRR